MSEREIKGWITVNGVHVPLFEGESKKDAISRAIAETNESDKERQIARNKEQADQLNGKNRANEQTQAQHKKAVDELSKPEYDDGTYDVDTKKEVSFDKGFQVTFCQIGDNYTPLEYAKKVNECLDLSSNGKTYAGKFESTPEISFHCNDRAKAIAYARANNQISIWDWEKCEEIKTGGTGRRK